jgi:kinetochore protein NDC80
MDLEKLFVEKAELQKMVDMQEISPADVDRMNSERDALSTSLAQLAEKQDEINTRVWDKEVITQREMDKLEGGIKSFNGLAIDLGLAEAAYEDNRTVRFELSLNLHAGKAGEMVNLDIANIVKPTLVKLRIKHKAAIHRVEDENIVLADQIDQSAESVMEKEDELAELQVNIEKLTSKYNEQKEVYSGVILMGV